MNPSATAFDAAAVTAIDAALKAYIVKYKDNLTDNIKLYPAYVPAVGLLARYPSALDTTEWGQIETINNYRLSDDPTLWTDLFANNVVPLPADPDYAAKNGALSTLGGDMLKDAA